jgi:ribosomal protein S1
VTRVAEFGAFVELEPGVEALAHASTFAQTRRPQDWKADVRPGRNVRVTILTIDGEKKRVGVAVVPDDANDAAEYRERIESDAPAENLGSLAEKLRGALKSREP